MSRFDFLNTRKYSDIYKACIDVEKYQNSDPSVAAHKARIALERILDALNSHGETLFEKIGTLSVPQNIEDNLHTVRKIGNKGSHGDEIDGEKLEEAVDALYDILTWMAKDAMQDYLYQIEQEKIKSHALNKKMQKKEMGNPQKANATPVIKEADDWYLLGHKFFNEHNPIEALKWYKKASEAGHIGARSAVDKLSWLTDEP